MWYSFYFVLNSFFALSFTEMWYSFYWFFKNHSVLLLCSCDFLTSIKYLKQKQTKEKLIENRDKLLTAKLL
jgi:hypothetical protein